MSQSSMSHCSISHRSIPQKGASHRRSCRRNIRAYHLKYLLDTVQTRLSELDEPKMCIPTCDKGVVCQEGGGGGVSESVRANGQDSGGEQVPGPNSLIT